MQYLRTIGVPAPTCCVDIFGFDADLLAFVPQPVYAVLIVFPEYRKFDDAYRAVYEKMVADGATVCGTFALDALRFIYLQTPNNLFFMRQRISNACGTFALVHALANNRHRLTIDEKGPLGQFLAAAASRTPDERNDLLAEMKAMETVGS